MSKQSYKLQYEDLYLYSQVTKHLTNGFDVNEMSSPFKDSDDNEVRIRLRGDAVRGYGRRQWQRQALESNRGSVIILEIGREPKLIGRKQAQKDAVEIFTTEEVGSITHRIVKKLIKHLEYNEVTVIKVSDKHKQMKYEKRWKQGDRVQREARNGDGW